MVRELMTVNIQVAQATNEIASVCVNSQPQYVSTLKFKVDDVAEEVKSLALWIKAVQTGQVRL
jgi:hypothetical protein